MTHNGTPDARPGRRGSLASVSSALLSSRFAMPSVSRQRSRRRSSFSARSVAVSDHSSRHSVASAAPSRRTSHADDSDAMDSDVFGETDEDVWYPQSPRGSGDINLNELDQLVSAERTETRSDARGETRRETQAGPSSPDCSDPRCEISHRASCVDLQAAAAFEPPRAGSETAEVNEKPVEATPAAPPEDVPPHAGAGAPRPCVHPTFSLPPAAQLDEGLDALRSDSLTSSPASFARHKAASVTTHAADFSDESTPQIEKDDFGQARQSGGQAGGQAGQSSELGTTDSGARFSFYSPGLASTVHAADLVSLVSDSQSFSRLLDPANGTWLLDCLCPTAPEMKALSRAFGIHPLSTEDILTQEAREKYEQFRNYYFVVYNTFDRRGTAPRQFQPINFYMLVFKEGVICCHFEPAAHARNVRRRMRQIRDYVDFSPDWIAYALVDDITDSFAPEIVAVEAEADFVEEAVYLNGEMEMPVLLQRLGGARKHTMQLLRLLSGKADVVRGFAKRCSERSAALGGEQGQPGTEMGLYLGDIQDHLVTMYQNLSAYEKIFSRTHFNYMGLLQMEFVDSSNRMTSVLGKVTMLGTILLPMNLITGLFGMNVLVPGKGGTNLNWFFGILGLIIFLAIALFLIGVVYIRRTSAKHSQT